jgi:hypothetical protein
VTACLSCGYKFDAATQIGEGDDRARPSDGAVSICLNCAHLAIFTADGGLREPTDEELLEILAQRPARVAVEAIAKRGMFR